MEILRLLPILAITVSCAPQDVPPASSSAQFGEFPKLLFSSFETDCAGPGEDYVKAGQNSVECHELLSPQTTAFLILNYDGYTQDLPRIVTRLSSTKNNLGYRVDANLFFLIPQKNGSTVKVPVEGNALDRDLSDIYIGYGGTPVQ